VLEWNDLYLVETWKCWNGISSRTEHALCCFKEWLCPSVDGQHRVKQPINSISAHITSHQINPSWLGQNGGWRCWSTACTVCVCVCVCVHKMWKCQTSQEIDLSAEKRLFQPYSFSSCISLSAVTGHFISVFPTWWDSMAPEGLKEGVVLLSHSVWEEFGSGVWELVFVQGELCFFMSFS